MGSGGSGVGTANLQRRSRATAWVYHRPACGWWQLPLAPPRLLLFWGKRRAEPTGNHRIVGDCSRGGGPTGGDGRGFDGVGCLGRHILAGGEALSTPV